MERALALYAQVLGKRFGVNIVWQDSGTASTDGKTIYVDPRYRTIGTKAQAATLFGLIAHETGHLRLTDFAVLKQGMSPLLKSVHNILEDVWMEREFTRSYPSVWADILESTVNMRSMGLYGPATAEAERSHPGSVFANFVLTVALARHYGLDDFSTDAKSWSELAAKRFGVDLVERARSLIEKVDGVCSTSAAMDLARSLLAVLQEVADAEKVPPQGLKSPPSSAAQALEASEDDLQDVRSEKGDALKVGASKNPPQSRGRSQPINVVNGNTLRTNGADIPSFEAQRASVRAGLCGRLERLLEASVNIDIEYRRSGGRLDCRLLSAVRLGRPDVFIRRDDGEEIDTAVSILLDGSGSMEHQWAGALSAAYAVMDVMRQFSVPTALDVFGGDSTYNMHGHDQPWVGMREQPFKMPDGGTPTAHALDVAASVLLRRAESRKIVILVTDGAPNGQSEAIAVAREARLSGVEVAHVFLGSDGEGYEQALRSEGLGRVGRCRDENDAVAVASAIEEALVGVMAVDRQ